MTLAQEYHTHTLTQIYNIMYGIQDEEKGLTDTIERNYFDFFLPSSVNDLQSQSYPFPFAL